MTSKKFHWLKVAFQLKGSVVSAIYRRVLACGLFGVLISILYHFKFPVYQPIFESVIPSIVLGLLLVFRTNTANDRFWEGRKCWGSMVNDTRNLARQIWVSIDEINPEDKDKKIAVLNLVVAFSVATKLHLREEPVNSELEELVRHSRYLKLKNMNNPPLEIAFWIGDYLEKQYNRNCLNTYQLISLQNLLNNLVDSLGACERILKTPIPLAYAIHLKQLLLLYCFLLPFQLVESLRWGTGLITALVSFTLFGIEAIGLEIENPFGYDANDLQLDGICKTMKRNIDDLITLSPGVRSHQDNINN
jgi:putative membrane protein